MNTITLKDNQSDHFQLITYPDGQHNIILDMTKLNKKELVTINCRIKNFAELEVLLCLGAALHKNDFHYEIFFAYLFGIRDDRGFCEGQPNYFRDVVAKILITTKALDISVLWPFSPLSIRAYGRMISHQTSTKNLWSKFSDLAENKIIIAGDKSAREFMDAFDDYPYFEKKRINGIIDIDMDDKTIDEIEKQAALGKEILIVDDLCDGGATFIEEAKGLKSIIPDAKLSLFVCHGLFTKGIDVLLEHFEHIYCTNSYQDINHQRVTQFEVI